MSKCVKLYSPQKSMMKYLMPPLLVKTKCYESFYPFKVLSFITNNPTSIIIYVEYSYTRGENTHMQMCSCVYILGNCHVRDIISVMDYNRLKAIPCLPLDRSSQVTVIQICNRATFDIHPYQLDRSSCSLIRTETRQQKQNTSPN